MGKHTKPKSRSKYAHWSESQREQACAFYVSAGKNLYGPSFDPVAPHKAVEGRIGDQLWTTASQNFISSQRKGETKLVASRYQYKAMVRTYLRRWSLGESCRRQGKGISCPLSQSEIELAVRVLGTPIEEGDNHVYFETISECISRAADGDKLSTLLQRKQMSPESLHRLLVDQLKVLSYTVRDLRDELPDRTLQQRRTCSDIWAGRLPWLENPSPTRGIVSRKSFFQWSWYFSFIFMIDAVTFDDGIRSRCKNQKVYQLKKKRFGPQTTQRKRGLDTATQLMIYVVLHPHGGIVAGPSLVLSGSRLPQSLASQKSTILAPWCA
jgi:hypothetical protein